jgi:hypothetical protein
MNICSQVCEVFYGQKEIKHPPKVFLENYLYAKNYKLGNGSKRYSQG